MRIALLGTRGIPANYGGFETFAEELSVRLAERGHQVTVYCREQNEAPEYRGVRLRHLPTIRHKYFDTVAHTGLSTADLLLRRFDVVLYCNAANAIFTLWPRLLGMPTALNVDGVERHRKKWNQIAKAYYLLSEWIATWSASKVITDAETIREYYYERYGKQSTFIPYGAAVGPVPESDLVCGLGLEPGKYVLYVSRLEPENNALLVRQAFESVQSDFKLVIVGDAPYAEAYIQEVKNTTDGRILFPGAIYGQGYQQLQSHCHSYVQATEVGGTHPALIEAMGRGALVLYLDNAENSEVGGDAAVPFRDDLPEKLQWAVRVPKAERDLWGAKAMRRVERLYSWNAVTDAYEELFRSLLQRKLMEADLPKPRFLKPLIIKAMSSRPELTVAEPIANAPVKALPYRSWVEVSRPQIGANFQAIKRLVGDAVEIMPVVKADAYRHGAIEVSRTLEEQGARWLAVSNTEEGVQLREAGIRARILVMADFLPFTRETMLAYRLTPVIHTLDDIAELDRLAQSRAERIRFHFKIDSGLGRLGVRWDTAGIAEIILAARNLELEGLMSHLASPANYQTRQTDEQIAAFDHLAQHLNAAGISPPLVHLSASIPIAYGRRRAWRGMVRPGHAIYGYVSPARGHSPARLLDVKPALAWRATVLSVKDVPAGASIGYGGMFKTTAPSRVATLAAGYADGIPHRLSNRGSVIVHGQLAPILGAVSMDMTSVDVTHIPRTRAGDVVTLLGAEGDVQIDAQQIARIAGTISYSVLCGIHARVKRVYI